MDKDVIFKRPKTLNLGSKIYEIKKPWVMGILNITQDSFYDGGSYLQPDQILKQAEKMLLEGAEIIDVGAQSTRPGAAQKTAQEELTQLLPAINLLLKHFPKIKLSIDTFYAKVAQQCVDHGAMMINDISGSTFDAKMMDTMAKLKVPYVLMHTLGKPDNMQDNPKYEDVIAEIIYFLSDKIHQLVQKGLNDIIIDPGFGFGKTLDNNYQILNSLEHFSYLERPILVGLSRKSMMYKLLKTSPQEVLPATTALHMQALLKGADILRVHDVAEAKQCIEMYWKLQSLKADK